MVARVLIRDNKVAISADNKVLIADDANPSSDCYCCDPPVCRRCEYIDGEEITYGPGRILPDLGVSITADDRYYMKWERSFERENLTDWIGQPPYDCCDEFGYQLQEFEINGLSGLNGTHYRIPNPELPGLNGLSSLGGSCGGRNIYADDPSVGCAETDPCAYNCMHRVFDLYVPITGTWKCISRYIGNCQGSPQNHVTERIYSLEGYALVTISPLGTWKYGDSVTLYATITVFGNAIGTGAYNSDTKSFNYQLNTPTGLDSQRLCPIATAPRENVIQTFIVPQCQMISLGSFADDFTCYPLWYELARAPGHTCILTEEPDPTVEVLPGDPCNTTDSFAISYPPSIFGGTCPIGYRYSSLASFEFSGYDYSVQVGWTL